MGSAIYDLIGVRKELSKPSECVLFSIGQDISRKGTNCHWKIPKHSGICFKAYVQKQTVSYDAQ